MNKKISLVINEAYPRDVGKGCARLDYESMQSIGACAGDIIELVGKKRTVARILPLYPTDENKNMIRIDGLIRHNSMMALEDNITIQKIIPVPAEMIFFSPLESIPPLDERYIVDALENIPLSKDDHFMIPYFGGRLAFQVHEIKPDAAAVIVTNKTSLQMGSQGITKVPLNDFHIKSGNDLSSLLEVTVNEENPSERYLILKIRLFLNGSEDVGEFQLKLGDAPMQPLLFKYQERAHGIIKNANERLLAFDLDNLNPTITLQGIKFEILQSWKNID